MTDRITQRELGRATLARQMLLERADVDVGAAVERLVGLQAQAPNPPYVGLWTRVAGFRFEQLTERLEDRTVVRSSALRGTLHLLTAGDFVRFRALLQPLHERYLLSAYRRHLDGIDPTEVADAGRRLLAAEPRDNGELAAHLAERWPDRDTHALTSCVRFLERQRRGRSSCVAVVLLAGEPRLWGWCSAGSAPRVGRHEPAYPLRLLVPLIHVPPAGTWGHHRSARLTPVESWLGRPLDGDSDDSGGDDDGGDGTRLDELVVRYLAAFGPATAHDLLAWSGLSRVGEVRAAAERLGDRVVRLTAADGDGNGNGDGKSRELLDLAGAPRPTPTRRRRPGCCPSSTTS